MALRAWAKAMGKGARVHAAGALGLACAASIALAACAESTSGYDAGNGPHSCADCAQAAACCQAVLASEGNTTNTCASSEAECQGLQLDAQREYIFDCDAYLAASPQDAAACQ